MSDVLGGAAGSRHPAGRLEAARQALADAETAAAEYGVSGPAGGDAAASDSEAMARRIVLRQLAVGPRTRHQLEGKLADRDCDPQVARRVLDRMAAVGLVDDEAYAEAYVRSRQENKGLAVAALRHELRKKGIAEEVTEAVLTEVDPEQELEQARALVARRLHTMTGLDRQTQTRRLAGFLARKGYASGVSYRVIREALDELPEHGRD